MTLRQRVMARLGLDRHAEEAAALRDRVQVLEQALQDCKRRNADLAEQLRAQREKTRALYERTKEYAERLQRKG